jgi:hypothetical protein
VDDAECSRSLGAYTAPDSENLGCLRNTPALAIITNAGFCLASPSSSPPMAMTRAGGPRGINSRYLTIQLTISQLIKPYRRRQRQPQPQSTMRIQLRPTIVSPPRPYTLIRVLIASPTDHVVRWWSPTLPCLSSTVGTLVIRASPGPKQ